jgi:imidazolonepropionase-like amidohydrolase
MNTNSILLLIVSLFHCTVGTAQDAPPPQTLFTNVHVWDGTSDGVTKRINVLVENNLIKKIRADASDAHSEAEVVNAPGMVLMPGLIDSHVHLTHMTVANLEAWEGMVWDEMAADAMRSAREYLMSGFTTVRDMGGTGPGIKRALDRELGPGPRLYPAGPYISQTSGHGDLRPMSAPNSQIYGVPQTNLERLGLVRLADGVPNVLLATREALATGSVYLKLMAGGGISSTKDPLHTYQFTEQEVEAAVTVARHWDTYVAVHAYGA